MASRVTLGWCKAISEQFRKPEIDFWALPPRDWFVVVDISVMCAWTNNFQVKISRADALRPNFPIGNHQNSQESRLLAAQSFQFWFWPTGTVTIKSGWSCLACDVITKSSNSFSTVFARHDTCWPKSELKWLSDRQARFLPFLMITNPETRSNLTSHNGPGQA